MKFSRNNDLQLEGTISEMLEQLKVLANPNCNRCYGRGYVGYREREVILANGKVEHLKTYIVCNKCVSK